MKTFNAYIRGEDGTEFTQDCEANSISEARDYFKEQYPEGTILEVYEPRERERQTYERSMRIADDPYCDDYDY